MSAGRSPRLVLAAEVALAAVTLSVVLGMDRLFSDTGWLRPLLLHTAAAHVVVTVLRRRGLSLPVAALVTAGAAALAVSWVSHPGTTLLGIPTGDTWAAIDADLSEAWALYKDVKAPTPTAEGFVIASAIAVWLIALLADWAAFRVWVSYEATLPASTVFLLTAMLGVDAGQGWAVGLFAAAVVLFLLVHRTASQEGSVRWVGSGADRGPRAVIAAGAVLGSVAVLAGTLLGPSLPGADREGLLDVDSFRPAPPRTTVSPLVDIRGRLIDQAPTEVFRVRATAPAYWRLTSLDDFDGLRWQSSNSYRGAGETLPYGVEPQAELTAIEQEFTITGLSALWLPGAFVPRGFESLDEGGALYDEDSATLIVDRERETSDGMRYRLVSTVPRFDPAALAVSDAEIPDEIAERYLGLPEGFSPRTVDLARMLAPPELGPYGQAKALQDHLRTFRYDLTVPSGHATDALERFLFEVQAGYCEQFAASFAAMARAVGLPSRVAVGFTPGEEDPESPGTYVVRGLHAHAWPEVYLAGAGWVPFEPTPGRGQPFADAHTGVAPAQASTTAPDGGESVETTTTTAPLPGPEGGGDQPAIPSEQERVQTGDLDPIAPAASASADDGLWARVRGWVARAAVVLVALAALYAVAAPATLAVQRARRRRDAASPVEQIEVCWTEVAARAQPLGYREDPSRTPRERAERLEDVLRTLAPAGVGPLRTLAAALELAAYAPTGTAVEVEVAQEAAAEVARAIVDALPWSARVAQHLDLRPVVGGWRRAGAAHRQVSVAARRSTEARRPFAGTRRGG